MNHTAVGDVLRVLKNVKEKNGYHIASCPAHDDEKASLSVAAGKNGVVYKCHAGCVQEEVHRSIVALLGTTNSGDYGARFVEAYQYSDENGVVLYESVRQRNPKQFYARRSDGNGGWIQKDVFKGVDRVLYNMAAVKRAVTASEPVAFVEGEKDVASLNAVGVTATTVAGGASAPLPKDMETVLAGATVFILPDNDDPGRAFAARVATALPKSRVRIVELPGLGKGGDVTDWLSAGGTPAELLAFFAAAPLAMKPSAPTSARPSPSTSDDMADVANAQLLYDLHGARIHYVPRWNRFIIAEDGATKWTEDHSETRVKELAKDVGRELKRRAVSLSDPKDSERALKAAHHAQKKSSIDAMVTLVRGLPGIAIDHEDLDADPWVMGVRNGILELRTGTLRGWTPADLTTMQCPVRFDPSACCPRWDNAMAQWFSDEAERRYVQRLAGSALVGLQRDHVFAIHIGPGGNGKGTYIRALLRVLGPYGLVVHLSLLVETKHPQHDTVKADLFRKRFAVASETKGRARLDEASVKNLTGGDRITARRMRENPWEFSPSHSLCLQTNHLPQIHGRDRGIWRRIRVVRWNTVFDDHTVDRDLDATLEAEASGILRWLVDGCMAWQRDGLAEPESIIRETLKYRASQDKFSRFIADNELEFGTEGEITAEEIKRLLEQWCTTEGIVPNMTALKEFLEENGAQKVQMRRKGEVIRVWKGIGCAVNPASVDSTEVSQASQSFPFNAYVRAHVGDYTEKTVTPVTPPNFILDRDAADLIGSAPEAEVA